MSAIEDCLMSSETVGLTVYDLALTEVSVKSIHSMFKIFELLVIDVNFNILPMANKPL